MSAGFRRIRHTFRNLRNYRMLFLFLLAFLLYNDGLFDPAYHLVGNGSPAFGALYLRSWDPIRKLPRPQVMSQSRGFLAQGIYMCGERSLWTLGLFGWPQIAAMGGLGVVILGLGLLLLRRRILA